MTIPKYVHRCIIQKGDLAGNENTEEVDELDLAENFKCAECGEPLASIKDIVVHIYGELLK